jgi:hypothetical protein
MILKENVLVYPEGDTQEIRHRLQINQIVDLNGNPLRFPLRNTRIIAYRVYRISTRQPVGYEPVAELQGLV